MKILMTGATGYVGSATAKALLAAGHEVTAALRDASRTSALPAGAAHLVADLNEPKALADAAPGHDAVLHLGFPSHGADWFAAVEMERAALDHLADALTGTETRLIVTNGTIFLDPSNGPMDEDTPVLDDHPAAVRARSLMALRTRPGLACTEVRLASFVHGRGGSVFLPILMKHARETGEVPVVDDGAARLSALHVDDAAQAFLKLIAADNPAPLYHVAADDSPTARQLAEATAAATGASPKQVKPDEAAAALDPFTAMFLQTDNRLDSRRIRCELGWAPQADTTLIADVAFGSYR
ncbi:NAD-dependent epimerase/dehydratase family protein [Pontivivens ytuae]|uniref:NAD(P)H-binding protein n=1 Tax=Pontivivens ytuae TaxID=2789856 RepID=A0A7S9LPC6_9RHOB|nr:NAD-dependent epimerase/dehydratase family protein [Pontivivens ytuae]QPH52831.1 NAD(P)H-binding protein [Pontivivens ytuae]